MEMLGYEILSKLKNLRKFMHKNTKSQFKELDITGTQGMMIGILFNHSSLRLNELSKKMGLSNATVSGIVDRLEKKNIVKRVRSENDRRVVNVSLNKDFKENSKNKFNSMDDFLNKLMDKSSNQELEKVLEGLTLLEEILNRNDEVGDKID
ncbi:MarR family winged helix-turn-helix transcriptional regulator [Helicovermis profundi]|uniref:MarR family transcriptional regulator n=1 Tax=Helicovermis profundi TaxID=3065157 RepID=A0AAU9ECV7_9FIRM|nr:MarR family transcriptional regulator [Clostridia bacterium S502]